MTAGRSPITHRELIRLILTESSVICYKSIIHDLDPIFVTVLLLLAAYHDVATRSIPNRLSVMLVACGLASQAATGPSAVVVSVVASILLFCLLLVAHARSLLGGGDVKLMAAMGCGLSLPELYRFIMLTAVAGGVLAGIHLSLRHVVKWTGPTKVRTRPTFGLLRWWPRNDGESRPRLTPVWRRHCLRWHRRGWPPLPMVSSYFTVRKFAGRALPGIGWQQYQAYGPQRRKRGSPEGSVAATVGSGS